MKKKTRCYIYTRVSTAIQVDGYSLDAQKDKLRKYAEFQDIIPCRPMFQQKFFKGSEFTNINRSTFSDRKSTRLNSSHNA